MIYNLEHTLLDDGGEISEYILDVLKELKKRGIMFLIVTARDEVMTRYFEYMQNLSIPFAASNGAAIVDPVTITVLFSA